MLKSIALHAHGSGRKAPRSPRCPRPAPASALLSTAGQPRGPEGPQGAGGPRRRLPAGPPLLPPPGSPGRWAEGRGPAGHLSPRLAPPLPALRGHRRGAAPSCRHAAPSPRAGAPPAGPAARTRTYGADGTTVSQPRAAPTPTPTPTPSALLSQPPARPFPSGTAAASPGQPDARAASGAVSRHPPRGSPHARLPSPGRPSLGPEPRRADAASPPRRR